MANDEWIDQFPNFRVFNTIASKFDHSSILLKLHHFTNKTYQKQFCFKNSWFSHHDLPQTVEQGWSNPIHNDLISKLNNCLFEINTRGCQIPTEFVSKLIYIKERWKFYVSFMMRS